MTLNQALNQIIVLADAVRKTLLNGETTLDLIPVMQAADDAARAELQDEIDKSEKSDEKNQS